MINKKLKFVSKNLSKLERCFTYEKSVKIWVRVGNDEAFVLSLFICMPSHKKRGNF